MLSVVVVGRNDNHGYNLGKRVASSLNSISMRLREGDELIFVDWNTPRPFPPMPVSIVDDLTDQTKKFLRILVVDPKLHDEVKGVSTKMILEPIARNVGIRRANPMNEWILSTNTDILFIGEEEVSFQNLISQLDARLWQSFRYEIPEYIWEVFDKRDPRATNRFVQKLSECTPIRLNLTTSPIENSEENLVFADAIGDFQLAPRQMWQMVKGFPEEMLNGWHVDSRAAVQMIHKSGKQSQILPAVYGLSTFHQNHLRSLTHFHSSDIINNAELIREPYENKVTWGISDREIYEYVSKDSEIDISRFDLDVSKKVPDNNLQLAHKNNFYSVDRAVLFLLDELNGLKPNDQITILSANESLIEKLNSIGKSLKITIVVAKDVSNKGIIHDSFENSNLIIIDFGVDEALLNSGLIVLKAGSIAIELPLISKMIKPNTRVVLIRAQNWAIRTLAKTYFTIPLFNNYSAVLSGVKKLQHPRLRFFQRTILLNGVKFDYGLPTKLPFFLNLTFKTSRKFLPSKARGAIRKMLIK
jgi:hypothetical protein